MASEEEKISVEGDAASISHADTTKNEDASTPDLEVAEHEPYDTDLPGIETKPQGHALSRIVSRISTTSVTGPPPDGGRKAWLQCAMAWLVVFNTWGYVQAYGSFQAYYITQLNVNQSTISWIGSVQVFVLFIVGVFSGRALDAGLFMPTFIIGVILQLVGIFTTSVSKTFWQLFLSQGLCTGIGSGIFFTPAMALVATYFSTRRGIAVAIVSTGNSAGGMIYPVIVTHLLPKIGFGWTVRVLGFINLACLSLVIVFMRPRLPPRTTGPLFEFAAFKRPAYSLFAAFAFFAIWSLYFTSYYIASYGVTVHGLSYSDSVTLLILFNGAGIPVRLAAGLIADRFGVLNTFVPLLLTNAVVAWCWLAVTGIPSLYAFSVFYGVLSAAWQSLIPTTVTTLTDDLRKTGTLLGMTFSVMSIGGLTGPPVGGALLGLDNGGYLYAQIWAAVSTSIAVCLLVSVRITKHGSRLKVKG